MAGENEKLNAEAQFAVSLLKLLPQDESSVFSPISISFALSLIHSGAKGTTRQEIVQAILQGVSDNEFQEHQAALLKAILNTDEGVEFNVANRFFLRDSYPIISEFLEEIKKLYAAQAVPLNFDDGVNCAKVVNDFITKATKGKIEKMVNADAFFDAVAILVNAIYMKAEWLYKFYSSSTFVSQFTGISGENREVQMMSDSDVRRDYYADDLVQALSLKYQDESYKFTWILPVERNGLVKVRSELDGFKLQQILNGMEDTRVNVQVPKMKVEGDLKLVEMLKVIGVTRIFSDNAELTGISEKGVKVSDAAHKAVIEVDEEGTVAAAVTTMKMVPMCLIMGPDPINFTADHPFIFVITHDNHPVFMGQYC